MDRRKIIPQDMPQTVTVCNIMYALGSMNGRANGAFAMASQCQGNKMPQPLLVRPINQAPEGKLHQASVSIQAHHHSVRSSETTALRLATMVNEVRPFTETSEPRPTFHCHLSAGL